MMATIKITRVNEYVNRIRAIKIFANGKQIGEIKNGETKEFMIPAGSCRLQSKIDWCSSNILPLDIEENEMKEIMLSSFANGKRPRGATILYYTIFATNKYLKLS